MIYTLGGILLLLSPFLLLHRFENKRIGFCYILSFLIALHLFVAIITQMLHIFTYSVILTTNIVIFLIIVTKSNIKKLFLKVDWILIAIIGISCISLFSVHYNYSGKYTIATNPSYQEAEHMSYPYPYFSDEWYSIAFIKDAINFYSLPIRNPLTPEREFFINLEAPFHSFLATILLLLHLDPLTQYTVLTIVFGLLIVVVIYLLLVCSIDRLPAAIASISTLYITNGANLPGIWNLRPLNIGMLAMVLGFIFLSDKKMKMATFMGFVAFLFYPPLFIFYTVAILFFAFLSKELTQQERMQTILYYFLFAGVAGIVVAAFAFFGRSEAIAFFEIALSKIFYPTPISDFIPKFTIYNIVPIPILLLALLGIIPMIKKPWLLSTVCIGITYWILYSFTTFRFIIEYARVVFVTALLIIIVSGFGLSYLLDILKKYYSFKKGNIFSYVQIGILLVFLVLSFNYTKRNNWQKLVLRNIQTNEIFAPAAPANRYLHPDDLQLFEHIKGKRFSSIPWKGTVIGVATGNYPLVTKPGTITLHPEMAPLIRKADCSTLPEALNMNIAYVYVPNLQCPDFDIVDVSSEGFYLYKFRE